MSVHSTLIGSLNAVERKLNTIPNNVAEDLKTNSEQHTPVVTGRLKAGYEIKKSTGLGNDAVTFNEVPYAVYVEYGTSKFQPRGMMRTAGVMISPDAGKYIK